jgi:hypothetical protein
LLHASSRTPDFVAFIRRKWIAARASSAIRPLRSPAPPAEGLSGHLRRIRFKDPETGKTLVFLTNNFTLPAYTICALYKALAEIVFQMDQAASAYQSSTASENAVKSNLDRRVGLSRFRS